MSSEWVISPRFSEGGDWVVHRVGLNRPHKIAYCSTRERAQQIADVLNTAIAESVAKEREACIQAIEESRFHKGKPCGCGECVGAGLAIEAIRNRGNE